MAREGSAMQRALSQRATSQKSLHGAARAARMSSLASAPSRSFSRSVGSGPAQDVLPLAIAMLVCGTRGDVQVGPAVLYKITALPSRTAC